MAREGRQNDTMEIALALFAHNVRWAAAAPQRSTSGRACAPSCLASNSSSSPLVT